jgi:hypothetical protein
METLGDEIMPKLCPKFICKYCDYSTSKKSSFDNHNLSAKHQKRLKGDAQVTQSDEIMPKICHLKYQCENCNKSYESRNGLWKHKNSNNCFKIENDNILQNDKSNEIQELKEIMKYLMKENSEMKNMMFEVMKNGISNTNNSHNTTNSHNKAFNLQFFLNETCKDAMNIGDFVDSLKLQLSDLEKVGEAGYIEGISSIIVKNLKELDVTKRPVHCTDKKRETVYIKDDDKWEKDEDQSKMHKLIKRVATKNIKMFDTYREAHPDCQKYHSKFSDQYNKLVVESLGGSGDNDLEKEDKIIKKIAKEVTIDKSY